jgi:hypothetical protein
MSDPTNPFSKLAMGAVALHEMFVSFTDAGFNDEQALELLKHVLTLGTTGPAKPPTNPPNYPN